MFYFTEHRIIGCKILVTYDSRQPNTIVLSEAVLFRHQLTVANSERRMSKVYVAVHLHFAQFSSLIPIETLPTASCYILKRITFITYITSKAKSFASQKRLIGVDSLLIEGVFSHIHKNCASQHQHLLLSILQRAYASLYTPSTIY